MTGFFANTTDIIQDDFGIRRRGIPTWVNIFEIIYLSMIGLIGTPGNLLIILVQRANPERTSTDYLVVAMACHEMFCSSVNNAVKILMHTGRFWATVASDNLCRVHFFLMYTSTQSSSFLLASIAIDRCIKTCRPLCNVFSLRQSKIICVASSVAGLVLGSVCLVTFELNDYTQCGPSKELLDLQLKWDTVVTLSLAMVVATFIVSYTIIAVTLRKRVLARRKGVNSRETTSDTQTSLKTRLFKIVNKKTKIEPLSSALALKPNVSEGETDGQFVGRSQTNTTQITSEANGSCEKDQKGNENSGDSSNTNALTNIKPSRETAGNSLITQSANQNTEQTVKRNKNMRMVEVAFNRTTRIMFMLSAIYIVLWTITSIHVHTKFTVLSVELSEIAKTFFMMNCITNPILFFTLSMKYRQGAKQLLCGGRRR